MKQIGFIGIGIMGASMVKNLMKSGYTVSVYSRTKSKAFDVIEEGACWCDSISSCVEHKDMVITMVGYPEDVEQVYFGEGGILESMPEGTCVVDMTTTSPKLAVRIYEEAAKRNIYALDAPVTGGDTGARNGTLTILAGGDFDIYETCLPVFQAMGKNITYQGKAGNGQHTKMCNQIAIAGSIAGVCEAMVYAQRNGLDVESMVHAIGTGAAGSAQLDGLAPRILSGDFEPGFFIKHFIKDMKLAADGAADTGIHLEVLEHVLSLYENLASEGLENKGTQALIQYYKK